MTDEDWATRAGLRAMATSRAERIAGWRAPVVYAVGYRRDGEWHFPHINQADATRGLPAVLLAEYLHYASGTREFALSPTQLDDVIALLVPAEAATDVSHPNLVAWRAVASSDADEIAAVFIGSLADGPAGPADAALRGKLTG